MGNRGNFILERMARNIPVREHMSTLASRRGWPGEIRHLSDVTHDDQLDLLGDQMIDAEISGDWSALISEAENYPAWRE